MPRLTPAETVIEDFGIRPLATAIKVNPTTVIRWRKNENGLVPSQYHRPLLDLAKKRGSKLTAEELINGRYVR